MHPGWAFAYFDFKAQLSELVDPVSQMHKYMNGRFMGSQVQARPLPELVKRPTVGVSGLEAQNADMTFCRVTDFEAW